MHDSNKWNQGFGWLAALAFGLGGVACTAEGEIDDMLADESEDDEGHEGAGGDEQAEAGGEGQGGEDGEAGSAGGEGTDGADGAEGADEGGSEALVKVDLLLVLDNSPSMLLEHLQLRLELVAFLSDALDVLAGASVHVAVTTTDGDQQGPNDCGLGLGALGHIDLLGHTHAELLAWIGCATAVGCQGDPHEQPAEDLIAALDVELGFSRPDATLIVVVIGDEDDHHSPGDPSDWVNALIDLHGGDADSIVMLGLLGDESEACSHGLPLLGGLLDLEVVAEPGLRLRAMIEAFEHHHVGSLCAPDHDDFFAAAIEAIVEVNH
ncbi:hypothetical protein ACNOYE_19735 [Nannocystaceae bacterium ST9]